jgi:hypothetical protein
MEIVALARYNPATDVFETTEIPALSYKTIGRIFVLGILATHGFFLWSVRDRIARGDPDFTAFYGAGKILRERRSFALYDPRTQQEVQRQFTANDEIRRGPLSYIHPPFEALLFVPLTVFSYPVAFLLWNVANLGMLFAAVVILRRSLPAWQQFSSWELLFWTLAFFPIFATFHQGQDAILLLLVLVMSFRALTRHSDLLSGCWLGFGIFKYHLILPLAVILAIWRGRRFTFGFATSSLTLAVISLALVGWDPTTYPRFVWQVVSSTALGGIPWRGLPNVLGLLGGWPFIEDFGHLVIGVALASSVALLLVVAGLRRFALAPHGRLLGLCFACAVIAALLVGYGTNTYDLSLLIVCLAVVVDYCAQTIPEHGGPRWALLFPAVPLLISPLWFFLWLRWERINLIAIFLLWWFFAIRKEVLRANRNEALPMIVS